MRKTRVTLSAAAFAAATLTLGLAGCSTDTGPSPSGSGAGAVELTMSGWAGDESMAAIIAGFEAANPGVTIKHIGLPWPNILTQINTELVSNTASDIVVVFPGNGNPITAQTLAKGSFLEDLTSQSWTSNFNAANQAVMGADGKVLMGANNFTIIPAIYNTQALEALGKTAPTTFSDVLGLCKAAKADGKVAYAMAGLAGGNLSHYIYALTATLVYGPNPDFAAQQTTGDATFSDSEWTTSLDKFLQMSDAGCFTTDPLGTAIEVAQGHVAKGDAVAIVTVSNQIGDIETMAPEGTTFQTAPLPATDNPDETILPVGLGAGYGVNASSEHMDLANKFMEYYLSTEGVQVALDAGSLIPSVPVDGYEPTATLSGVYPLTQGDKTVSFPDQSWPNSALGQIYNDEMQKVLGGQTSPADALAVMDAAFNG